MYVVLWWDIIKFGTTLEDRLFLFKDVILCIRFREMKFVGFLRAFGDFG